MIKNQPDFSKKLNLLQAYRGLAALLVVMFHLNLLSVEKLDRVTFFNLFRGGWSGVDYFFTLSGFIMVYVYGSIIGDRRQWKSFFIKRAVRIYPSYWIVSCAVIFFLLVIPGFAKSGDLNFSHILSSFLLLPQIDKPILEVGWTLIYEIFFYFLFGLAILLKPKYSVPILSVWLSLTILHYLNIFKFDNSAWLNLLFGKLNLEFVLGCLAGYAVLKFDRKIQKNRWLIFGIANLVYLALLICFAIKNMEIDQVSTFGLPAALLVMSSASIDRSDGLKVPWILIYLGDASYSIYLTHGPVISATIKLVQKAKIQNYFDGLFAPALLACMAISVGCIFYTFIEKPLLRLLRKNVIDRLIAN